MNRPRRIVIAGNAGTGKSVLARRLGEMFNLPVTHLDKLLWQPGWALIPEEEFARRHTEVVRGGRWVIEGVGYPSTFRERCVQAELVILLQYPIWRCVWWSLKREVAPSGAIGRPPGSTRVPIGRLMRAILATQRDILPEFRQAAAESSARQVRISRSPASTAALVRDLEASRL